ncbi:MAG: methanethiol S-methyltransferase [Planctomycetota bacterium]
MRRWSVFAYGLVCYASFVVVFAYTMGFVSGVGVPKTVDGPAAAPPREAALVDVVLLVAFAVQHSLMARASFKRWWTQWVPESIERSTYVIASSLILGLLFWQWQPIAAFVWHVESPPGRVVLHSLQVCGWLLVLVATALINHADLFGLRQVMVFLRGRRYFSPGFVTPGPYHIVRHPLYLGWLLAFWATPDMTGGHLLFAGGMTGYVRLAIAFEERDLLQEHGRKYREYRSRVPMLLPWPRR